MAKLKQTVKQELQKLHQRKKVLLPSPTVLEQPVDTSWYGSVWRWFKNSETILIARLDVIFGFLVAALSAADWSSLVSLGMGSFTWQSLAIVGGALVVHGFLNEWARRRNTVDPLIGPA